MKKLNLQFKVNTKKIPINKIPVNDVSSQHHSILKHYFNASQDFQFQFNHQLNSSIEDQVGNYNVNIINGFRASSAKIFLNQLKIIPI